MTSLLLQKDIFSEDEVTDTESTLRKYFDVTVVKDEDVILGNGNWKEHQGTFRGSLTMAHRLGRRFTYADALMWAPAFREHIVSDDYYFLDAVSIKERGLGTPKFIRPTSGSKAFSGNVYSQQKFEEEFKFMTQNKNIDPFITCLIANPTPIKREWRVVFVNQLMSSGSQYMVDSNLNLKAELPEEVGSYAEKLVASSNGYFQNIFDFVIDVGEVNSGLKMIEINAFETASFYAADLDKIYSDWAKSFPQ